MNNRDEKSDRNIRLLAEQLGVSDEKVRHVLAEQGFTALAVDSLDVVELVIELEDEPNSEGGNE